MMGAIINTLDKMSKVTKEERTQCEAALANVMQG